MQEEYSGAIYIIGPNSAHFYAKELAFLNSQFKKLVVIGDGEMDILNDDSGPLQNLKTLAQDHPELLNEGKILVYIHVHGKEYNNKHYIHTNKGGRLASKQLFQLLAQSIKKPIDIIFLPCNGKSALADIDFLTLGSRIIIFSDTDKYTISTSITSTFEAISNDEFSLENFYNNYLAQVFMMDESPLISTAGGETIDPIVLSETYLGKAIGDTSRQYVRDNFGQSVCKNDAICHDKIDYLMNKIEQTSSIEEFKTAAQKPFFELAKELSQMEQDYAFIRNTHHDQAVPYNHRESEHCYIEILDFKNKIDQLFFKFGFGLELDLSHELWYEIDYDYDDSEDLDRLLNILKALSADGIYNLFIESGMAPIENDNLTKPESEEYGFVLGIIKDIHLSLSLVDGS